MAVSYDSEASVRFVVNGEQRHVVVNVRTSLADALREHLGLTGTKLGCEQGVCGACSVLIDGAPARSCLMLAVQADGCEITTVEGLTPNGHLSALQESFQNHHALQCGFCTAGVLVSASAFLARNPSPDRGAIREAIAGNLCRCTGYQSIVDAIKAAADEETA
jgi:aerobic carbon-monoxide dehydrogenase small subunit